MNIKKLVSNWQWLELIGKFLILFSICFQLIIIGNATSQSTEIDRVDSRNSYNLDSSNYKYLVHLIEVQGLETQRVTLQNQRLLVQIQRLININYDGDKLGQFEFDKSLQELNDAITSSNETNKKQSSKIWETIQQAANTSESSEEIRLDLRNLRSKNNTDLKFLNYVFLILFAFGSMMVLKARFLEMKIEKHPADLTDPEPTIVIDESE